jgi:hypothetical protein
MAGIELKFLGAKGAEVAKGPFPRVRLEGEVIRSEPGGPVIAHHEDHHWEVDGLAYGRLECHCPRVQVRFERIDGTRSKTYGPLRDFSFVDGIAYMEHQVFAFADRTIVDWYCHADGIHWPLMIIEPAP